MEKNTNVVSKATVYGGLKVAPYRLRCSAAHQGPPSRAWEGRRRTRSPTLFLGVDVSPTYQQGGDTERWTGENMEDHGTQFSEAI